MNEPKSKDLNLRIANLFLAIILSTVPTLITYGTLSIHGLNICRRLNNSITTIEKTTVLKKCNESAWSTTKSYIFLIGFFITLPTWLWFYLSMKKKIK